MIQQKWDLQMMRQNVMSPNERSGINTRGSEEVLLPSIWSSMNPSHAILRHFSVDGRQDVLISTHISGYSALAPLTASQPSTTHLWSYSDTGNPPQLRLPWVVAARQSVAEQYSQGRIWHRPRRRSLQDMALPLHLLPCQSSPRRSSRPQTSSCLLTHSLPSLAVYAHGSGCLCCTRLT